ncbi:MAG: tRNA 2-selenouridine(34) synthase MnmH [Candidatus Obscuribacterales bacterium]|nr:tRNA 2-selenouridine(34) synthase MnmH [Candidatus Obscuribacterales bacterium]
MTWRELSPKQLSELKDPLIIDVRSPSEHDDERILGSMNVPLLSDIERAEVGTLYVQQGEVLAKRLALKYISPKIPEIVDTIFAERKQGQTIVVHCWRGGLRSEAVASFLSVVGFDCFRLTGGYKAWRKEVIEFLDVSEWPFTAVVLQGLTGAGKTDILKELEKIGCNVLDLEELANHRGSAFGGMGQGKQPTQKNFEAAIYDRLKPIRSGVVFMEAEGRKVGNLNVPKRLLQIINTAPKVLVTGTKTVRIARLVDDYAVRIDEAFRAQALAALSRLKERLGGQAVAELASQFEENKLAEVVERLLLEYYDPLYGRHIDKTAPYALTVSGDEPAEAARLVSQIVWTKNPTLI